MNRHHTTTAVLALALALIGPSVLAQDTGTADFTRYVALGDSLTAGVSNNSLIYTHQATSLGRLLYLQTGGAAGGFEQPYVDEPGLRNELFLLSLDPGPIITQKPGTISWPSWEFDLQDPDPGSFPNFYLGQPLTYLPYDNLGIPGMRVVDADSIVCDGPLEDPFSSPFYCTILRNPECETVFNDPVNGTCGTGGGGLTAVDQALFSSAVLGIPQPTFMSVWLGSNDVLDAAVRGLVIEGVTYTPIDEFTSAYQGIISRIDDAGVQMVIANVPDVTAIPWVTTIPPFLVDPITGEPLRNPVTDELIFLIGETETGPRSLTLADRVLLSATLPLSTGTGFPDLPFLPEDEFPDKGTPLGDEYILDATELAQLESIITAYNDVIATEAQNVGAAFVDVNSLIGEIRDTGVFLGGLFFTTDFLTGGLFGYDGVHPTNLGYGIITQWFVDAINETYGGSIPPIDLGPLVFGFLPQPQSIFDIIFGSQAQNAMLGSMGLPDTETLQEIKKQKRDERMSPHRRRPGSRRDALERRTRER